MQGTDQVKRLETTFAYDDQKRLISTTTNGGPPTKYFYGGNTLERAETYDHQGNVYVTHFYQFASPGRLSQKREVYADGNEVRTTYYYQQGGNLATERIYRKNDSTGNLEFTFSVHYEGFDDKKYAESATSLNPYVPRVNLWVNNYTLKTLRGKKGEILQPARQYSFKYDENDYPVQKTVKTLTDEPSPLLTAAYAYENRP